MKQSSLTQWLWGEKSRVSYLLIASCLLIFFLLGGRDIWTQEHRWADIVTGMFYRHDYLHPFLGEHDYYDKPLLSYWLIVVCSYLQGALTTVTLRLPSALAGLLAIFSIYRLGLKLKGRQLGLLSGWLLLTTYYFLFWARVSSADMLNLAGSLFAVSWYMDKRDNACFFDYAIFFVILALTSLCKGLVGAIVPLLAVFTDMVLEKSFQKHLRLMTVISALPGLFIYLLPFWASSHFGGQQYGENGLYLVYRENVLRYFQPFDHRGPIYTYFIYLPVYLLPWTFFFIPAIIRTRYSSLAQPTRWVTWTLVLLFLFFTVSGSRRSYYVLPIIPYAVLFTADWLLEKRNLYRWVARLIILFFCLLFLAVDFLPAWYDGQFGMYPFANTVKTEATKTRPWENWQVMMLDAESKLNFYLKLAPSVKQYDVNGGRYEQTKETLLYAWPILKNKPKKTIFITRKLYLPLLREYFPSYRVVQVPDAHFPLLSQQALNAPVAFIPEERTGKN